MDVGGFELECILRFLLFTAKTAVGDRSPARRVLRSHLSKVSFVTSACSQIEGTLVRIADKKSSVSEAQIALGEVLAGEVNAAVHSALC